MIRIIYALTLSILSWVAAFAQASEYRKVNDFTRLKVSTGVDVHYTIGSTLSVLVEVDNADKLSQLKTEVTNGQLSIYWDSTTRNKKRYENTHDNNKVRKVTITGPSLEAITTSSSAEVHVSGVMKGSFLELAASSSSTLSGDFQYQRIHAKASSSGQIEAIVEATDIALESSSSAILTLRGNAQFLEVTASSSSSCIAKEVKTLKAEAAASSSASISLTVALELNAKASSSGSIHYFGKPEKVSMDKSSSGSITQHST